MEILYNVKEGANCYIEMFVNNILYKLNVKEEETFFFVG